MMQLYNIGGGGDTGQPDADGDYLASRRLRARAQLRVWRVFLGGCRGNSLKRRLIRRRARNKPCLWGYRTAIRCFGNER